MPTPFSISAFPVRGYSIAEEVVGVKYLDAIPFGSRGQAFKRLGRLQLLIVPSGVTATISYQDGDLGKGRVVLCVVPEGENCKIKHPSAKDAKHAKAHETKNEGRLGHPTNLTGNLP